jgi:hypothetical protein
MPTLLDVSNGAKPKTDLGKFVVIITGAGGTIPKDIPFSIVINMTEPFYSYRAIRGFITKGTTTSNSMGDVKMIVDSDTYELMGSEIVLYKDALATPTPLTKIEYNLKQYFEIPLVANGDTKINATMTQTEPLRLMLRSVGYGPRGSQKILEAFIRKNLFDGLPAPATLTLVGDTTNFKFNSGNSTNVKYSGIDFVNSKIVIPPIGTTDPAPDNFNLKKVIYDLETKGSKTDVFGTPANVSDELPAWLKDPTSLEKTIAALEELAAASGRVFNSGQTPTTFGDFNTATGITFVKGNVDLEGSGGGILVCTGTLAFKGNFAFSGLIIVIGDGGVIRKGGGGSNPANETGTIQGNVVVAPYDRNNIGASFLSPKYDMSGGGKSDIVYNSSSTSNGQEALSNLVLGIAEK